MMELLWPYLSLAFSAFISATLLPFGSELVLAGLLTQGYPALLLWGIATVFNTLGSVLNWYLGRQLLLFQHKSWFMFKPTQIEQASSQFQRWGLPSLLLAWLPVIGDPLTLVAGVLRVRLLWFVLLVGFGKGVRYAVVIGLMPAV
jgi:membrane protein YqaA with SNARE-associated domain